MKNKRITLKTHYNRHIVTVNGKVKTFKTLLKALKHIAKKRGRKWSSTKTSA